MSANLLRRLRSGLRRLLARSRCGAAADAPLGDYALCAVRHGHACHGGRHSGSVHSGSFLTLRRLTCERERHENEPLELYVIFAYLLGDSFPDPLLPYRSISDYVNMCMHMCMCMHMYAARGPFSTRGRVVKRQIGPCSHQQIGDGDLNSSPSTKE